MNPSSWFEHLAPLTFLRPHWLWALLALPLLGAWWWRGRSRRNVWRGAVDAHLLPHLLENTPGRRSQAVVGAAALGYALAVLALAGPSWSQGEQPLWQGSTPMVVALDLSSRTLAGDLPPSRLAQAKAKLAELLRRRAGSGQTALVVYADDAYTVSPLTDDPDNVRVFLDALAPDIMPGDGQNADRAIAWSAKLLRQGGFDRGRIVLMTDRGDSAAERAAAKAAGDGYTVSVLGLGSASGAAFQRPDGRIVKVRLDAQSLTELARAGGGRYLPLSADDSDLRALDIGRADSAGGGLGQGEKRLAREDDGYWLLPPLVLLALLAFRRRSGAAALALLLCLGLPLAPAPARAQSLWQRADQSAHARIVEGNDAYRTGQFERAAELYQRAQGADAQYNLGNALARQGRYPEAIAAYDRALKQQPGMEDAIANKRAVEAAMKRPPPKNQDGQNQPKPSDTQQGKDQPSKPQPNPQQKPDDKPQDRPQKPDPDGQQNPQKKPADDPEAQRRADQDQRERMQRELDRQRAQQGKPPPGEREAARTPAQRERQQANDAWLKRVPDDPGSLLRERFKIEYGRRQMSALEGD